jgi:hypothetical protein
MKETAEVVKLADKMPLVCRQITNKRFVGVAAPTLFAEGMFARRNWIISVRLAGNATAFSHALMWPLCQKLHTRRNNEVVGTRSFLRFGPGARCDF